MTRRERLAARLARRQQWAQSADHRSSAAFDRARSLTDGIPFGQPILVGHHSEKRHRRTIEKSHNAMHRGCEEARLADHHRARAGGLADQLERSIFTDDPDATDQLEERVADLEAERDRRKAVNAWWKRHKTMQGCPGVSDEAAAQYHAALKQSWRGADAVPYPPYSLSNLGARIRLAKKRQVEIARRQQQAELAAAAPGGVLITRSADNTFCNIQFAEKPERAIIEQLKAAGFHWAGGCWCGYVERIPAAVLALVAEGAGQ